MKVGLVIDELHCLDFVLQEILEEAKELDEVLGMKVYEGIHKESTVRIFFCKTPKDSIALRAEDLFVFFDIDVLLNVGYCFITPGQSKLSDSDVVLIASCKSTGNYKDFLSSGDIELKRYFEVDKKMERRAQECAAKYEIDIKSASCCSLMSFEDLNLLSDPKNSCLCFDQKAFALYALAYKYNRQAVCIYRALGSDLIDVHHYLSEKSQSSLNDLIKIALEFEFRCRALNR